MGSAEQLACPPPMHHTRPCAAAAAVCLRLLPSPRSHIHAHLTAPPLPPLLGCIKLKQRALACPGSACVRAGRQAGGWGRAGNVRDQDSSNQDDDATVHGATVSQAAAGEAREAAGGVASAARQGRRQVPAYQACLPLSWAAGSSCKPANGLGKLAPAATNRAPSSQQPAAP